MKKSYKLDANVKTANFYISLKLYIGIVRKRVYIRNFSDPYFPASVLKAIYEVNLRLQQRHSNPQPLR